VHLPSATGVPRQNWKRIKVGRAGGPAFDLAGTIETKGAPSLAFQGREAILLTQFLDTFRYANIPTPALRKVREERGTRSFVLNKRDQNPQKGGPPADPVGRLLSP
jgi:hypothetical protein